MILSQWLRINRLLVTACLILVPVLAADSTVDHNTQAYLSEIQTTVKARDRESLPPMFIERRDLFYRLNLPVDLRIRLANTQRADDTARG